MPGKFGILSLNPKYSYQFNGKRRMRIFHGSNVIVNDPKIIVIVEGPMADDTIYNYIQNYMDGKISRAAFWELAKFKYPTHQISFHSISALDTLKFIGSEVVYGKKK